MKYHKIRNIPLDVCTAEQKIAYNIAFRAHISFQDKFDEARKKSQICVSEIVDKIISAEMKCWKLDHGKSAYNIDAIFSALRAGLEKYLENPFIASDYGKIGKAFPAHYLESNKAETSDFQKRFKQVCAALDKLETRDAYRLAWKKPCKFYREHTAEEAIEILKNEAEENSK